MNLYRSENTVAHRLSKKASTGANNVSSCRGRRP